MQANIQLSGAGGLQNYKEFDQIQLEELIKKFREAVKNRDKRTICITVQVAFPDLDYCKTLNAKAVHAN